MPNFSLPDSVFDQAAREFPTPFYLYDELGIQQAAKRLYEAFAWNKGFREYYAVKALPNPHILQLLMEEGCGLDCSSHTELLLAKQLKAKGADIMFSANAMPGEELALAYEMGAHINLDDVNDITLLQQFGGVPDSISLRVNPGEVTSGNNLFMGGALDAKFGMMPSQLPGALKRLKELGLKRFGLHCMTASNTLDGRYFVNNAAYLLSLGLTLETESGLEFEFINLSGGLGIPYRLEENPVDVEDIAREIKQVYKEILGKRDEVAIYTELGRWMTGPYGWLVSRAIHEKEIWRHYIGLDATAANLLRPAMYGAYHHVSIMGKRDAKHDNEYDITGSLCENTDKFAVKRLLPKIDLGDIVLIHDAGAHGHAMGYQYNGRLRSAEILYTKSGEYRLIRRAETPADYFATLV